MSSKTKIVVFKAKELVYTGIFIVLGILLICLLFYMFSPKDKEEKKPAESSSTSSVMSDAAQSQTDSLEVQTDPANPEQIAENSQNTLPEEAAAEESTDEALGEATEESAPLPQTAYEPGVYTTVMSLGGSDLSVTVTVDADRISHVDIANIDETVTAMYPLLPTVLDSINSQISGVGSIDEITYPEEQAYTTILICDAIKRALE